MEPKRYRTQKIVFPDGYLKERYESGWSCDAIAKEFGCGKRAVRLELVKLGVKMRTVGESAKLSFKSNRRTKRTGEASNFWNGGKRKCCGYNQILIPGHHLAAKNGYVLEHRLIAEEKIGRRLNRNEEVHHLNGIRDDNRPENLVVMTKKEHMSLHMKEKHNAGKIHKRNNS